MAQGQTTPVAGTARRATRSTGRTAARSGLRVRSRASDEGRAVASRAAEEASDVASTAQDEARRVASNAAEEASDVAATATEEGQQLVALASEQATELGSTVREQTARVRGEVVEQGKTLAEEARSQAEAQAHAQSRRLADSLSRLGDEVRALAEGRPDEAGTVRPYVSNAADTVYDAADRLYTLASDIDTRGLTGVLDDLQAFARRRPGAFLLGAAVAGFGVGRAVRASSTDDGEAEAPAAVRGRSS
jgi:hypothetical protein